MCNVASAMDDSDADLEFCLEQAFREADQEVAAPAGPDSDGGGDSGAAAAAGPSPRPAPGAGGGDTPGARGGDTHAPSSRLAALSEPVLFRTLCFLSPDDLLALATTCSFFCAWASEPLLWRRAYGHRWADGPRAGEDDDALPWKVGGRCSLSCPGFVRGGGRVCAGGGC